MKRRPRYNWATQCIPGAAATIQGKFGLWWNSSTRRFSRQFFESPHSRDVRIWVNTVLKLISLKTDIARSVKRTKITRAHAEEAMAEPYCAEKFGDLITADHKVLSDNCGSRHNHRYASRGAGLEQPNGSRRIRARPKLHKKPREACKSSTSQLGILKSFTLSII